MLLFHFVWFFASEIAPSLFSGGVAYCSQGTSSECTKSFIDLTGKH